MTIDISFFSFFWSVKRHIGFSWNPIKGRWVSLSFCTKEQAYMVTAAVWFPVKVTNNLYLRIQTNA